MYGIFTGSTAPYHITQPSTDDYEQRISSTAIMTNITCALSISIPNSIIVTWAHNGRSFVTPEAPDSIINSGNAVTLVIRDLQLSDLGDYECAFTDTNNAWRLRRTITLG